MSKKKKTDHPFFCYDKNCRKTAWETPKYLTEEDWNFAKEVVKLLSLKNSQGMTQLYDFLWDRKNRETTKNFFNRTIGWPEGYVYCQDSVYFGVTAYPSWLIHTLDKLEKAIGTFGKILKIDLDNLQDSVILSDVDGQ